jgi:uncharacterized protein (TIGR02996 family)
VTREADLIAAIIAAPDDPAPFLVYGDFLQTTGDPRGELIALMHAGGYSALLKKHKATFVGKLASPSIKLEAWRLGFVDHVRLIADTEKHAVQLVELIAEHPSTQFMRTLEVQILGKRRSYAGVDARLVELGRPQTLKQLTLGKPGEHALSAALLETFPLVIGEPRKTWEQVAAAVYALRGGQVPFSPQDVAPVTTADGSSLPITADALLRGIAAEIGRKQQLGLVARLVEDVTPAMLDAYAASLVVAWTLHGEDPRTAWAYDAASVLGGAAAAKTIGRRFAGVSHARAEHAVTSLARMRSPLATLELHAASTHWATRGEHAELALEAAARRAKVDVLTLLARAGSDPRDAYDDDTLARFRELDLRVLELLMVSGWSAPLATVLDLFHRAPRSAWCSSLVWRTSTQAFTLDAPVTTDEPVRLVHVADPIDVARFRDRTQPLEQLARRTLPIRSVEELAKRIDGRVDIAALRARGYRNGGLHNELREEQRFVKTHRYLGATYTLAVQPTWGDRRIATHPADVPPAVLFELVRDLAAANGIDQTSTT